MYTLDKMSATKIKYDKITPFHRNIFLTHTLYSDIQLSYAVPLPAFLPNNTEDLTWAA